MPVKARIEKLEAQRAEGRIIWRRCFTEEDTERQRHHMLATGEIIEADTVSFIMRAIVDSPQRPMQGTANPADNRALIPSP